MIAVEVGEEHRPEGARTRQRPGRPHAHAPAGVEQEVPTEVRTRVDGPARSAEGMGLPLPRITTCMATTPRSVRHLYDRDYDMNCTPSRHDAQ